jgi:hypothetical protein
MRTARKSPFNSVKERRQEAFTKNEIASTSYSNTNILQYMHNGYCPPPTDHSIFIFPTGQVPENGRYWNSQFPLAWDISYPLFPLPQM